jgi:hypothetical protein
LDYQRHLDNGTVHEFVQQLVSTLGESVGGQAMHGSLVSGEAVPLGDENEEQPKRNIFPAGIGDVTISTWNSNGMLGASCDNGKIKLMYAKGLLKNADITLLQETHGDSAAADKWANGFRQSHVCFFSLLPEAAKGGVAICIKKRLLELAEADPVVDYAEPGRAMTISLKMPLGVLSAACVHDFDLKAERDTIGKIAKLVNAARDDVSGKSMVLIGGDFNFTVPGEVPARVGVQGAVFPSTAESSVSRARACAWAPALAKCVELHQEWPTRGGSTVNKAGDKYFVATRIDRLYYTGTPLACTLLNSSTRALGKVNTSMRTIGSDHVGVQSRLSMKKPAAKGNRPMPRWLAEHPKLAEKFAELAEHVNSDVLPAFDAIDVIKTLVRAAAKIVERSLYETDHQSPAVRMQCLLQLARAIGEGDAKGARRATKWMPDLAQTFHTFNDTISITDNTALEDISRSIALKSIEAEKRLANDANRSGRPRGGRSAALQRQALLWSPFKRQFSNVGIIKENGSVVTTGAAKSHELARQALGESFCS